MRPYMTATGRYFAQPVSAIRTTTIPTTCTTTCTAGSSRRTATTSRRRFDWNISNNTRAYVRIAQREAKRSRAPRGVWWAPADVVALPTPNIGENRGRSYAGNVVTVLSPTMTNEVLVSYSRLTLDNRFQDPALLNQGAGRHHVQRHLPRRHRRARICRPTSCTGGAATARSATCGRRPTTCTRTTTRCSSATS